MTEGFNPWVSRPAASQEITLAPTQVLAAPTGPQSPQLGIPVPDAVDQLPTIRQFRTAELWWLGVHGGAGESSLAALLPGSAAAQHGWPQVPNQLEPSRVILTARSNVRGLQAAQNAATQWAAGLVPFIEVLGLVIIADAPGKLPKPLRDLSHLVSGGVPRTWHVPWIESWRTGDQPELTALPRQVRRLIEDLQFILQTGASGTAV